MDVSVYILKQGLNALLIQVFEDIFSAFSSAHSYVLGFCAGQDFLSQS